MRVHWLPPILSPKLFRCWVTLMNRWIHPFYRLMWGISCKLSLHHHLIQHYATWDIPHSLYPHTFDFHQLLSLCIWHHAPYWGVTEIEHEGWKLCYKSRLDFTPQHFLHVGTGASSTNTSWSVDYYTPFSWELTAIYYCSILQEVPDCSLFDHHPA